MLVQLLQADIECRVQLLAVRMDLGDQVMARALHADLEAGYGHRIAK